MQQEAIPGPTWDEHVDTSALHRRIQRLRHEAAEAARDGDAEASARLEEEAEEEGARFRRIWAERTPPRKEAEWAKFIGLP